MKKLLLTLILLLSAFACSEEYPNEEPTCFDSAQEELNECLYDRNEMEHCLELYADYVDRNCVREETAEEKQEARRRRECDLLEQSLSRCLKRLMGRGTAQNPSGRTTHEEWIQLCWNPAVVPSYCDIWESQIWSNNR